MLRGYCLYVDPATGQMCGRLTFHMDGTLGCSLCDAHASELDAFTAGRKPPPPCPTCGLPSVRYGTYDGGWTCGRHPRLDLHPAWSEELSGERRPLAYLISSPATLTYDAAPPPDPRLREWTPGGQAVPAPAPEPELEPGEVLLLERPIEAIPWSSGFYVLCSLSEAAATVALVSQDARGLHAIAARHTISVEDLGCFSRTGERARIEP